MDILERWQRTFDHEEPDRVSSFVQAIMNRKKAEIDDTYGESFTEDELCITPLGDYSMQRWCGFESTWGAHAPIKLVNPAWQPARYLVEKQGGWVHVDRPPSDASRYRIEDFTGRISENMGDGRDINFYVEGNLYVGPGGVVEARARLLAVGMQLLDGRHEPRRLRARRHRGPTRALVGRSGGQQRVESATERASFRLLGHRRYAAGAASSSRISRARLR